MSEPGDPSEKIKVVDRRRFTGDGDVRPDWEPAEPKPSPPPDTPSAPNQSETTRAEPVPEPSRPASSDAPSGSTPLFLELVQDLAQQAALFIEGAQGLPANPAQAQRLIDYLGILETKTRGNLSAEEAQILSSLIFQLRTLFVQRKK